MKKKLFLTILCVIVLCLSTACGMDFDTTTESAAKNLDTGVAVDMDLVVTAREQEFFRNQNRSFSIIDEAMRPFRRVTVRKRAIVIIIAQDKQHINDILKTGGFYEKIF